MKIAELKEAVDYGMQLYYEGANNKCSGNKLRFSKSASDGCPIS